MQACGDETGLRLDLNYNFRTDGFCAIAAALTPAALGGRGPMWTRDSRQTGSWKTARSRACGGAGELWEPLPASPCERWFRPGYSRAGPGPGPTRSSCALLVVFAAVRPMVQASIGSGFCAPPHSLLISSFHRCCPTDGSGLDWLELDTYSPAALRRIRDCAAMPIASLESIMGRRALLPFLQAESVDVCIVDPLWNGVGESVRMAALCDTFEVGQT